MKPFLELAISSVQRNAFLICKSSYGHLDLFRAVEVCGVAAARGSIMSKPFAVKDIRTGVQKWLQDTKNHMMNCSVHRIGTTTVVSCVSLLEIYRRALINSGTASDTEMKICDKQVSGRYKAEIEALSSLLVAHANKLLKVTNLDFEHNFEWMSEVFMHAVVNNWCVDIVEINSDDGSGLVFHRCEEISHFVNPIGLSLTLLRGTDEGQFYGVAEGAWLVPVNDCVVNTSSSVKKVREVSIKVITL